MEKLAAPPMCPRCQVGRPAHTRSAVLASFLGKQGRCGGCDARPDRRAVLVELATAAAFWLLFLRFGPTPELPVYSLYACILIVVFFVDWEHRLILNRVTYPALAVALLLTPTVLRVPPEMALAGVVFGGLVFGAFYWGGYLLYRQEVLGLGDVKLAMVLGAMMGFPAIVAALLLGSFVGAVAAAAMLIQRRSGRDYMPYGTAMVLGAFIAFFLDAPWHM